MIADSSFIVALFHPDDSFYEKASREFAASESLITIPDSVMEETMTFFSYKDGWAAALEVFEKIDANSRFRIRHLTEDEWEGVVDLSAKLGKKMSFADYVVLYMSRQEGTPPLSYDGQLNRAAKAAVP